MLVYQRPEEFPDSYTSYHRVGAVISDMVGGKHHRIAVDWIFSNRSGHCLF